MGNEEYEMGMDELRIDFDSKENKFNFEFIEDIRLEDPFMKKRWMKECPINEGYSAFLHFLKIKKWFPVIEIDRGS